MTTQTDIASSDGTLTDGLQENSGSELVPSDESSQPSQIESLDDAIERCQSLGMRLSRQRRYILELLWQQQEHLSAREIYDQLNRQGREIGHTSVYQNLEALSEQGIIECVERSDGRLYGHSSAPHSHIICTETQKIMDVQVSLPADFLSQIEAETGMKITDYRIDFFGRKSERAES